MEKMKHVIRVNPVDQQFFLVLDVHVGWSEVYYVVIQDSFDKQLDLSHRRSLRTSSKFERNSDINEAETKPVS